MIKSVKVLVCQSFEGCVLGDEAWVDYTPRVQGLISAGLLQVLAEVDDGPEPEPEPDPPADAPLVVWPPPAVPEAEPDDG